MKLRESIFRTWLVRRRTVQYAIIALLLVQHLDEDIVIGNLSSMTIAGLELSDPLATLQYMLASGSIYPPLVISALLILVFYIVVGGRVFCSWVCPLHLVFEYTDRIKSRISKRDRDFGISTGYRILFLTLAVSLIAGVPAFEILSPIGMTTRALVFGTWFGLLFPLAIALFEVTYSRRGWCRYFCPLGAFYALAGKLSLTRVNIDHSRCTRCEACKTDCLVPHVLNRPVSGEKRIIDSGDCTNCGICVDVCPEKALKINTRFK